MFRHILVKHSNNKCHDNPSIGSRFITLEHTERHGEANRRISVNFHFRTKLKEIVIELRKVSEKARKGKTKEDGIL
jgi:hypothetical protein